MNFKKGDKVEVVANLIFKGLTGIVNWSTIDEEGKREYLLIEQSWPEILDKNGDPMKINKSFFYESWLKKFSKMTKSEINTELKRILFEVWLEADAFSPPDEGTKAGLERITELIKKAQSDSILDFAQKLDKSYSLHPTAVKSANFYIENLLNDE